MFDIELYIYIQRGLIQKLFAPGGFIMKFFLISFMATIVLKTIKNHVSRASSSLSGSLKKCSIPSLHVTCLFPSAIKPWQKACCIGVGITGIGLFGYTYRKIADRYNISVLSMIDSLPKLPNLPLQVYGIITPMITIGMSALTYYMSKEYISIISNTTKCCNIIRTSFIYIPAICFSSVIIIPLGIYITWGIYDKLYN